MRASATLGVTSPQRWPTVPDIPTIAETVPGFESVVQGQFKRLVTQMYFPGEELEMSA